MNFLKLQRVSMEEQTTLHLDFKEKKPKKRLFSLFLRDLTVMQRIYSYVDKENYNMNARLRKPEEKPSKIPQCGKSSKISSNFHREIATIFEDPRESGVNLQEKDGNICTTQVKA